MFCPHCGHSAVEGDAYCSSCGKALADGGAGREPRAASSGWARRWLRMLIGTRLHERIVTALVLLALVIAAVAFLVLD